MNLKEIKELIELVAEKRLAEFEMENGAFKLRIRHFDNRPQAATTQSQPATPSVTAPPPLAVSPPAHAELPAASSAAVEKPEKELHKIKAPIVGTFFRSAEPGAAPFVEVGDMVKKGQVLCIIEAMKLMNEIDSEYDGEVANIYVENGQAVQYGERLFAIRTR